MQALHPTTESAFKNVNPFEFELNCCTKDKVHSAVRAVLDNFEADICQFLYVTDIE
jgi:hypothetical protein